MLRPIAPEIRVGLVLFHDFRREEQENPDTVAR